MHSLQLLLIYIPLLCLAVIVLSSISTRLLCRLLDTLSLNFDMSCELQSIQALFPIICRLYFNCLSLILFTSLISYLISLTISSLLKFSVHHLKPHLSEELHNCCSKSHPNLRGKFLVPIIGDFILRHRTVLFSFVTQFYCFWIFRLENFDL